MNLGINILYQQNTLQENLHYQIGFSSQVQFSNIALATSTMN